MSVSTPIDDTSAKTNKTTNVYAAASSNSTVRRVLDANYSLTINAKCGDYYRVEFTDGTGSDSIFEGEYYINKSDLSISTSSIVFDTGFIELECGESHNTIVTILPAISNTTVRWFSSDDTIATVDQNGIITAVGAGITQITAVDVTNGVSNNIVVSVFKYSSDLTFRAIPDYNYIKDEIKPRIMIKDGTDILDKNSDYDVSYSNNVNVGTAEVTITFKNHYKGTKKLYFEIIPSEVEDVFEVNDIIDQKYNFGNPITPQIPVFCNGKQLVLGTDYNISYYNNIDCGTATAVITGMNGFTGSITKYFNITSISSSDPRISVSAIANVAYTGDSVTPSVTVQYDGVNLIKGQDYTVEYENNILMGLATARITFKGNYSGEVEKNFYIVPKKAEIISEIIDNSFVAEKDCVYFEYKSQADFIDNEQYQMIYLVERNDSVLGSVSNGFFDDDGLPSCTPYKYRIKAGYQSVDYSVVNFGEWSDYYYVGTAPDNLTLTVGHNSANYPLLTVTGQGTKSNGITVKYEIWRYENANLYDAGELSMLADNLTVSTYTDTSAQTGKSYWYTVRPYYEISVPESNGTTSIRRIYGDYTDKEWGDMPLPTPMNFTAVYNEETGDIRFTWKDVPSTMADKYHIVNYDDGGASQEGQIVEGNSYTWNAAELTPNTTYRFRILSENTLYNTHSNPSSCIIIITTLKTPQISKLSTGSNRNGIKIELSDTYLGRYYYEIYYSSSNTNGFKYINTISYKIPYAFLCDPDATYSFKVRAVVNQNNQKYYSEYSTIKSFTLGLKEPSVTSISRDDTNNCFNLQWSSVNKAVSYNIYAYKGGTTGKYIKNVTGASTNIPYSSLDSGSYYHFKVRAIGNNTDSDISSNYGLGVTPVSGLSVSSNSPGTATVVFTKGNCPEYCIEYKKSSESSYKSVTVDTNSHTIYGL
ncbi:MAG: Ig-like domain-containing protein, partial [Acutalibacteraceae bacterium]|nr:Ig-like domain-containing protein [Acutalibacteraceae bacterium]